MNRSAWGLAFVLSISGCTCEYHAGTGVSTSSGGERSAADIERERYERERYERERAARERAEWERRYNPHHRRAGGSTGGVHVTGRVTESNGVPVGAPPRAPSMPPGAAPAAPVAQPSAPVPIAPATPAPAPAPPAPTPAPPAPTPSDSYVRARTPTSREPSSTQRAGEAGDKAEQEKRKRIQRGTLQAQ
jgi:hypothetical protein